MRYNVIVAYALWLVAGCGALGFHRFYLGKVGTGILWMLSGGGFGIGSIYDLVTLPRQVSEANLRYEVESRVRGELSYGRPAERSVARPKEDAERVILRVASKNGGMVTPGEVALEGDISLEEARKRLEKLAASGNAEMRVRSSGVVVYVFPEFVPEGKDDFEV